MTNPCNMYLRVKKLKLVKFGTRHITPIFQSKKKKF